MVNAGGGEGPGGGMSKFKFNVGGPATTVPTKYGASASEAFVISASHQWCPTTLRLALIARERGTPLSLFFGSGRGGAAGVGQVGGYGPQAASSVVVVVDARGQGAGERGHTWISGAQRHHDQCRKPHL